jgi:NHLM bacteriocin system ABC transporter ATP-binding protein
MTDQLDHATVVGEAAGSLDASLRPMLLTVGEATLFLAAPDAAGATGRRTPVATLAAPALIALNEPPTGWQWVVGRGLGATLEEATLETDEGPVRAAVTNTIAALGVLLQPAARPPGERLVHLRGRKTRIPEGHGAIVDEPAWVQPVTGRPSIADVPVPTEGAPFTRRLVLRGEGDISVVARPLEELGVPTLLAGVQWLFAIVADYVLDAHERRREREAQLAIVSDEHAKKAELQAVRLLAEQLRARPDVVIAPGADPLVAAATRVFAAGDIDLTIPRGGLEGAEGTAAVRTLAASSKVYSRRVTLDGEWWTAADDPVLGFHPDGTPVALLPGGGGMTCVEPDGHRSPVNTQAAAQLLDSGFVFAKPVIDAEVDERTLARIAVAGRRQAIGSYVGWSILLALSGLAVPFAAGVVFNQIVPNSDRSRLWFLLGALVLVAIATVPLQLALTASRTRFETLASLDIQRGLWGRVLVSPVTLVRRLGAGDLAMRLSGLEAARDPIDSTVLAVLPSLLSGLLAGLVLFIYDAQLAVLALIAGALILGTGVLLARRSAREQRELDQATGAVNGFLFQTLVAIPKLRVAGAEARAFLAWADRFRFAVGQRLMRTGGRQMLLTEMIPTLGSLALFTGVAIVGASSIGVDVFVAFQTTFNLFLAGVTGTVTAAGTAIALRPSLERAIELTREEPESDPARGDQGRIRGAVEFANVTFRYQPTMRPVLDELTFEVAPGEMLAIAGHSGCGKSTIIRLLLGFEHPEQGSVLFDGQHLSSLDVEAVRRQLGVVLQDGQLIPGTVRENLAGVASLSEQDAWELAEMVALADEIRAMPMGLDTVVTMNGGAFSGGQRQRLLIARALAGRPRILLLDEATSSLDNVAQHVITENLARLGMTRIVVAHRLSTMVNADRILVINRGRVVEQGTYEDLMAREGPFHQLASRQIL